MIQDYYSERSILITGGTGFVGQALIAKILRDLPCVRQIYAFVRPRRGMEDVPGAATHRLQQMLDTENVFRRHREVDPENFARQAEKVVAVRWDTEKLDFGVEPSMLERMRQDVDTIFNSAATVVFDEPLDVSLRLNTHGPIELLKFAASCRKRVDFVHVSTAYVNGQLTGPIAEELLPWNRSIRQIVDPETAHIGFDPENEVEDCEAFCRAVYTDAHGSARINEFTRAILRQRRTRHLSESRLEKLIADRKKRWIERRLVDEGMRRAKSLGWNDVYTFTKAMGEQLLVKKRGQQPLVIVRPSIIESSLIDPEPGWITGLKVMDPLIAAYGKGMMPDFPARPDLILDVVPVDIVVNTTIAAACRASCDEVQVYHAATSSENPVKVFELFDSMVGYFKANPLLDRDGRAPNLAKWSFPSVRTFRLKFRARYVLPLAIRAWLIQWFPERFSWASPQKRRMLSTMKIRLQRALYFTDIYHPYTQLRCTFKTQRTRALFESLPDGEKGTFNMDVNRINWVRYIRDIHLPGLRRNVLRDGDERDEFFRDGPKEAGLEEERWKEEGQLQTISDLLHWSCARYGNAVALQMNRGESWERITYSELLIQAQSQAAKLLKHGLKPGDRVLLYAANSPNWVASYMASTISGLCVVPIDPQTREDEVWNLAAFTDAKALLTSRSNFATLSSERSSATQLELLFDLDNCGEPFLAPGSTSSFRSMSSECVLPQIVADMEASIIFTSGMAVEPRGVTLTHDNFISDLLALAEVQRVDKGDQVLSLLPLHHGLEFTGSLLMSLLSGATITYPETLNSRSILETMRATGTTTLVGVPRLLKIILDRIQRFASNELEEGDTISECNASLIRNLRFVFSGGAPLANDVFEAYKQMGITVYEGYGLTETAPIVTVNPPKGAKSGSVGLGLPGIELRIQEPDTRGCGEILVRGSNVMTGYLKRPELTAQVFRNGWLYTGDVGYLDDDGYLFITGRNKDLIVTGAGKNVYPQELEQLYRPLPHVAELGVFGVRSAITLNEEVHGVAVLNVVEDKDGSVTSEVKEAAHKIARNLPTYQRIQRLHIRHAPLPRTVEGEIDRPEVMAELQHELRETEEGIDESLAPWERSIYQLLSRITGLTIAEVQAHGEAPFDSLLDSLMVIEFFAAIGELLDCPTTTNIGRSHTLRNVMDALEPKFENRQVDAVCTISEEGYWARVLKENQLQRKNVSAAEIIRTKFMRSMIWSVGGEFIRSYFSLRAEGFENLPIDRPYVLAANHNSHLDAPAVLLAAGKHVDRISLAAAKNFFLKTGFTGRIVRDVLNAVPFDHQEEFLESLLTLRDRIGVRRPLLVFPEGTRSPTGELQSFKSGLGLLAVEFDLPVVPVHVCGTYKAWPKIGGRLPQRNPVCVKFGAPVEVGSHVARRNHFSSYEIYREVTNAVRREIVLLGKGEINDTRRPGDSDDSRN